MSERFKVPVNVFELFDDVGTQEEAASRKKALRGTARCVATMQICDLLYLTMLLILVYIYSSGKTSFHLQLMLAVVLLLQVLHAILLYYGAKKEKLLALEWTTWLGIALPFINTVLGLCGTAYFILVGNKAIHYVVAVLFFCLTCSICTISYGICIICALRIALMSELNPNERRRCRRCRRCCRCCRRLCRLCRCLCHCPRLCGCCRRFWAFTQVPTPRRRRRTKTTNRQEQSTRSTPSAQTV